MSPFGRHDAVCREKGSVYVIVNDNKVAFENKVFKRGGRSFSMKVAFENKVFIPNPLLATMDCHFE